MMAQQAIALYGMPLGPEGMSYINALFGAVEKAWKKWQDSVLFESLIVTGAGVGAWSGVGSGGVMTSAPFVGEAPSFGKNSPEQVQFTQALLTVLGQKFTQWPATYKFSALNYLGTSGATPTTPGPVSAQNQPTQLKAAGAGGPLKGIAADWLKQLKPPTWDLDNPHARSKPLVEAIGKTIEMSFESLWLTTTMATSSSIATAGTPGGAVPGASSQPGGKLV
jgi:hypothetical protein